MNLCAIIDEANVCAAKMASKQVDLSTFGNTDNKVFFDLLTLNAYIRTLQRNVPEIYMKKEKVPLEGQVVNFNCLKKQNNYLILETKPEFRCIEVKVQKCLSDDELRKIVEQVKLLCPSCNTCNCN